MIKKSSNFIQKAIKKPGQLHRDLGVPHDEDIPLDELKEAAKRDDKVGQRARLALTLRNQTRGLMHHSGKKEGRRNASNSRHANAVDDC